MRNNAFVIVNCPAVAVRPTMKRSVTVVVSRRAV